MTKRLNNNKKRATKSSFFFPYQNALIILEYNIPIIEKNMLNVFQSILSYHNSSRRFFYFFSFPSTLGVNVFCYFFSVITEPDVFQFFLFFNHSSRTFLYSFFSSQSGGKQRPSFSMLLFLVKRSTEKVYYDPITLHIINFLLPFVT